MEEQIKLRRAAGWQEEETERLLTAVKAAAASGQPLRAVFEGLSDDLGRKPNSIRNYYYACLRRQPDVPMCRPEPMRLFTAEEAHELVRQVLMARGQGHSVRSCVMQLAQGDRSLMLRYQNKYRTLLKTQPELIEQVCEELRREGQPCPEPAQPERTDAAFCDPEDPAAARLMAQPCVADMLEGLKELLRRAASAETAEERLRTIDRLKVENDLRRIAWEKEFDEAVNCLNALLTPLREYAAKPEGDLLAAVLPMVSEAEAFLTRVGENRRVN